MNLDLTIGERMKRRELIVKRDSFKKQGKRAIIKNEVVIIEGELEVRREIEEAVGAEEESVSSEGTPIPTSERRTVKEKEEGIQKHRDKSKQMDGLSARK